MLADQPPGKYTYAIIVYGTGPEHILGGNPDTSGLMTFDVEVVKGGSTSFIAPKMGKEPIIAVIERRGEIIYYKINKMNFLENKPEFEMKNFNFN